MKKKIGIIGFGNMGSAIAERIRAKFTVFVFDKDTNKTAVSKNFNVTDNIEDLVDKAEVVILAVKPQDFAEVLVKIKNRIKDKLIISIAAAISCGHIERTLGKIKLVRTMPNIGVRIGKSVTCICKGSFAADDDLRQAREIFENLGEVQDLEEEMMDAATAISGSGPGYYFHAITVNPDEYRRDHKKFHEDFVSSLSKAAKDIGFEEKTAKFLAHWTIVYSDLLLKETGLTPEELKRQVASKGGTTEAALEVLHRNGSLVEAVRAAVKRAKELSRG